MRAPANVPTQIAVQKTVLPDIMDEIARVLYWHDQLGGCTIEGCSCPGSQLQALYERLQKEFPKEAR